MKKRKPVKRGKRITRWQRRCDFLATYRRAEIAYDEFAYKRLLAFVHDVARGDCDRALAELSTKQSGK